jgi:DNA-directed RNA polymerase specialized sigma24 family protein
LPSSGYGDRISEQEQDSGLDRLGGGMTGNGGDRSEPYLGRLFGYAFSLTNERDLALESVQDCMVKVLAAGPVSPSAVL